MVSALWARRGHSDKVQSHFTEGRLAVKIEPTGGLLGSFIDLSNLALSRCSKEELGLIGIPTCPGTDRDSTHSADVDHSELLHVPFELHVGNFTSRLRARGTAGASSGSSGNT